MPEGPELKITTTFLQKHLLNKNITLEIVKGRYSRHPLKNLNKVKFPLKVEDINVKGKFIYFTFYNTPITLWITLGMSGHFILPDNNDNSSPYTTDKHNNISINYEHKKIWFQDYRNFGTFMFALTKEELDKKLSKIGLDMLELETKFEDFHSILREKRNNHLIGETILEQKHISGVGNYGRSEALYLANINPFKKVKDLSEEEMKDLFHYIRVVLFYHYNVKYGIKHNIIKQKDMKLLPEKLGGNGKDYNFHFLVYGQKEDPFGNKVHRKKDKNGRTIHWIPELQK